MSLMSDGVAVYSLDARDGSRASDLDVHRVRVEPEVGPSSDVVRNRLLTDNRVRGAARGRQVIRATVELAIRAVRRRARDAQARSVVGVGVDVGQRVAARVGLEG